MVLQNWFYEKDGEKIGPHSEEDIVKMLSSSVLFAHSLVWREGMQSWMQINEIANFQIHIGPPPLPTSHLTQSYMIIISTLPLWGMIIQLFTSFNMSKGDDDLAWSYYDSYLWFLMYAFFNGIFCMVDSDKLKKSGVEISYFWGYLFVPVYMYKRGAELFKIQRDGFIKNQMFLILWLIFLLLSYAYELYLRSN